MGLLNWWRLRQLNKQRILLTIFDGKKIRKIDAYRVWRELIQNSGIDIKTIAPLVDKGQEPETSQWIDAIAKAFDVKKYDSETDTGLTDWEILSLMGELDNLMAFIKKKFNPGPILPQPTD